MINFRFEPGGSDYSDYDSTTLEVLINLLTNHLESEHEKVAALGEMFPHDKLSTYREKVHEDNKH